MCWDVLPFAVLKGRYNIPFKECLCSCGDGKIENYEHVLLDCKMYNQVHKGYVQTSIRPVASPNSWWSSPKRTRLHWCFLGSCAATDQPRHAPAACGLSAERSADAALPFSSQLLFWRLGAYAWEWGVRTPSVHEPRAAHRLCSPPQFIYPPYSQRTQVKDGTPHLSTMFPEKSQYIS